MKSSRHSKAVLACGLAVVLATAACGSSSGGSSGANGTKAQKKSLILVVGNASDAFYVTMGCGAKAAAEAGGATIQVQGAQQFDATLQRPIMQAAITKHPDALLAVPTDQKAFTPMFEQAKAQGTKIVTVDQVLDSTVPVTQIASDNILGGEIAAKALNDLLKGRKGKVLVLPTDPGVRTTDERAQGFQKAMQGQSNIEVLPLQYTNNDPAKAVSIVNSMLAAHKDLIGIFATNVNGGLGAATALGNAGTRKEGVVLIEADATPTQVTALKQGTVASLISQKPYEMGQLAVKSALDALAGKPLPAHIATKWVIVTKETLSTPEVQGAIYKGGC